MPQPTPAGLPWPQPLRLPRYAVLRRLIIVVAVLLSGLGIAYLDVTLVAQAWARCRAVGFSERVSLLILFVTRIVLLWAASGTCAAVGGMVRRHTLRRSPRPFRTARAVAWSTLVAAVLCMSGVVLYDQMVTADQQQPCLIGVPDEELPDKPSPPERLVA